MKPQGRNTAAIVQRNKAVVHRFLEAFNSGDTGIIDELAHPNFVELTPLPGTVPGLESLKQRIRMFHEQFPDVNFKEESMTAEGDMVVLRWKMTGTNQGPIFGRGPTGKRITHHGTEFVRLEDGKIIEHSYSFDQFRFLDKLGLLDEDMLQYLRYINTAAIVQRNKAVVRRITEAYNSGDTGIIDEFIHPNILDHSQKFMGPAEDISAAFRGFEGVKRQIESFSEQFPDVNFEEESITAEGDMVVLRWKMTGTNQGPIFGRGPTGKRITHHGVEFVRLEDGKIIEHSDSADPFGFLDKLGLLDGEMLQFLTKVGMRSYEETSPRKSLSA
jgi:predicted ester cyclase